MRSGNRRSTVTYNIPLAKFQTTVPKVNKSQFRQYLKYSDPKHFYYNQLLLEIEQCQSLISFCIKIKIWLLAQQRLDHFSCILNKSFLFTQFVILYVHIN